VVSIVTWAKLTSAISRDKESETKRFAICLRGLCG
jgi:hypothetical protein